MILPMTFEVYGRVLGRASTGVSLATFMCVDPKGASQGERLLPKSSSLLKYIGSPPHVYYSIGALLGFMHAFTVYWAIASMPRGTYVPFG